MQHPLELNTPITDRPSTWENFWSLRASVEKGNDFDGLNRVGVTYFVKTAMRFGIGGCVDFLEECGCRGSRDHPTVCDINLLFRFDQSERTQFRFGLGARLMHDHDRVDAGVNVIFGMDFCPNGSGFFVPSSRLGILATPASSGQIQRSE